MVRVGSGSRELIHEGLQHTKAFIQKCGEIIDCCFPIESQVTVCASAESHEMFLRQHPRALSHDYVGVP